MSDSDPKVIEFGRPELDPSKAIEYKRKIANARNSSDSIKGPHTPLGHVERPPMPLLAQPGSNIAALPSGLTPDGGVAPRPPGSPSIRPETAQQVAAFQEAQKNTEKKVEEEGKKAVENDDTLYDLFDSGVKNEADLILNNKKRRKEIEARCSEMSIEDLIMKGEVRQTIPIIPDKFVIVLRSNLPEENLFIKRIIAREPSVSDQHTLERYGLLQLCIGLVSINGQVFPSHMDEKGPNEDLFNKKYEMMMKLSGYIIADLGVQIKWFDIRVRKLMNPELLGNG